MPLMSSELRSGFTLPAPGTHRLLIKNMVYPQCVRVVKEDLTALGLQVYREVLGEADVFAPESREADLEAVRRRLLDADSYSWKTRGPSWSSRLRPCW